MYSKNYYFKDTILKKTNNKCAYCGCDILQWQDYYDLLDSHKHKYEIAQIDHIHSKFNGGEDHPDNLIGCCKTCNSRKGKRNIEDFRMYYRRLQNNVPSFTDIQLEWLIKHTNYLEYMNTLPCVIFHFEENKNEN